MNGKLLRVNWIKGSIFREKWLMHLRGYERIPIIDLISEIFEGIFKFFILSSKVSMGPKVSSQIRNPK